MRTNWPNSPWTRRDLKRLGYYPLTLILGKAFERSDPPTQKRMRGGFSS
jgi:hypothetical protein